MYKIILDTIKDELSNVPSINLYDIVLENEEYTPTVRQRYIRMHLLPAAPFNVDKITKGVSGLVQLDIYSDIKNDITDVIADNISEYFHDNPVMVDNNNNRVIVNNVRLFNPTSQPTGWYKNILFFSFEYYLSRS